MGVGGNILNWKMDFLNSRSIQIKIGSEISSKSMVENGTPQGSVTSSVPFSVMINDILVNIQPGIGHSLWMMAAYGKEGEVWMLL